MKYMILVNASQRDYDAMAGSPAVGIRAGHRPTSRPWASFMESLARTWPSQGAGGHARA